MSATTSPDRGDIPLCHVSIVSPFLDFFSEMGAPLKRGLARAKLPTRIVDERDGYVPCRAFTQWVASESRSQGIDDIGSRVFHHSGLDGLHQSLTASIAASPNLLQGLRRLCTLAQRESPRVQMWLEREENDLLLCHRGSFPRNVSGQVELTWWTLGIMTSVVRLFLGQTWLPMRMGFPAQGGVSRFAAEIYPDVRFVAEEEHAWIAVSSRHLAVSACGEPPARAATLPEPTDDLVASLKRALLLYQYNSFPTIDLVAEMAGTSLRTIQRRITGAGTNYRELIGEIRMDRAVRLLLDQDMRISDVAREVGYDDSSHFARAFRRRAGISPHKYRHAHAQQ
jgi:AraC-like DNA-binding protein